MASPSSESFPDRNVASGNVPPPRPKFSRPKGGATFIGKGKGAVPTTDVAKERASQEEEAKLKAKEEVKRLKEAAKSARYEKDDDYNDFIDGKAVDSDEETAKEMGEAGDQLADHDGLSFDDMAEKAEVDDLESSSDEDAEPVEALKAQSRTFLVRKNAAVAAKGSTAGEGENKIGDVAARGAPKLGTFIMRRKKTGDVPVAAGSSDDPPRESRLPKKGGMTFMRRKNKA
ncbi:hypothetical protein BU14_0027s0108 [Porphyra umbilicalis]|uniref:Uncharacterized protein n=1 Tax=Porphyra umbilicalis TaxID=2786 RepID=A0A1X6PJP6_PORUM|nr:hypothetical protein BU14_0027s0108 [Porphyra umbilicalis]|eukprot:OSX81082.1 hypothetical protein BU14_0027s0108 [Porphyra umbilicalis]